jgi:putative transcriptional regulator
MEAPRDRTMLRIQDLLEHAGFYVIDTHKIRPTTFDLMARRDSVLLIIKVLKNIDALDPEEAKRLGELGSIFPARPLVVGESSGTTALEPGVVYNRYGVPVVAEETFREAIQEGVPPFLLSRPGGVFARIDGERLKQLREAGQYSLGTVASAAGVSRRTIQLYEEGNGAEITVVERIEAFFGEPIVRPIDLFEDFQREISGGGARRGPTDKGADPGPPKDPAKDETERTHPLVRTGDPVRDGVFRQLNGMGWEVVVTIRCPFDALTQGVSRQERELLLTTVGSLRSARHRADILQKLARVSEGHALFIVREARSRTSIDGLPVVSVHELRRHRDRGELLDLISEREN